MVTRPFQDGQDQVSVPQVPLLGHGDAIETLNLGGRDKIPDQCLSKQMLCSCHVSRLWGMSWISWHLYFIYIKYKLEPVNSARLHDSSWQLLLTGSGARGAARNCDFLAESIATINPSARIRCVLDGIDLVPYWVQSPNCFTAEHRLKEKPRSFCLTSTYSNQRCIFLSKRLREYSL